jgi:hypothetical protein
VLLRATLRDGNGRPLGSDTNDAKLTVASLLLTEPLTGEVQYTGLVGPISWEAASAIARVGLRYSENDGKNWFMITDDAGASPNLGIVPPRDGNATRSRIKAIGYDAGGKAVASAVSGRFTVAVLELRAPNGGDQTSGATVKITWDTYATKSTVTRVLLFSTVNHGKSWKKIADLPATDTSYNWTIPSVIRNAPSFKVKVVLKSGTKTVGIDSSDAWMRILAP